MWYVILMDKTLEDFPYRSPLSLASDVKHLIAGKSVCDLGCGAGDLLVEMKELGSAGIAGIEDER